MRAVALVSVLCGAAVLIALTPSAEGTSIVHMRRHAAKTLQALEGSIVDLSTYKVGQYYQPTLADLDAGHFCRAPCPALNTLANHGFLNRNGMGITKQQLHDGIVNVIGLESTFGDIFTNAAMDKFANPATQTLSLCDALTSMHTVGAVTKKTGVEHAASLSRADRPMTTSNPPQLDFSAATDKSQRLPTFAQSNMLLSHADPNTKMISVSAFVAGRDTILKNSYKTQPLLQSDSGDNQMKIIAAVEGCLLLGALSGNSNGGGFAISSAYATSFLQQEKFPDGWVKSANAVSIPRLLLCVAEQGFAWAAAKMGADLELAKHWIFAAKL